MAIVAEQVSKVYRLYDAPQDRLKEMLASPFGRRFGRDFWALREVSFSLQAGTRVGLVGRNGSGKSTLLQILAGTLAPSAGDVLVQGRVAALLELGSGFNPEYTGRENIFVNAALLGLTRQQTEARFDAIAAFADIGAFLDQPVKTYSSGMFMRLAFAVTTCVDADVLLIDEALAVGDVFFTQKCYRHLQGMVDKGVTVVLVTHDATAVMQFCQSVLVLDAGRLIYQGETGPGVRKYHALQRASPIGTAPAVNAAEEDAPVALADWPSPDAFVPLAPARLEGDGVRGLRMAVCDTTGRPSQVFEMGEEALFFAEFELATDVEVLSAGVEIVNERNLVVHGKNAIQTGTTAAGALRAGTRARLRQRMRLAVAPGTYTFNLGLAALPASLLPQVNNMSYELLAPYIHALAVMPDAGAFSVVPRRNGQQLPWHGLCDLEGDIALARGDAADA